jgi:hypothetical protein
MVTLCVPAQVAWNIKWLLALVFLMICGSGLLMATLLPLPAAATAADTEGTVKADEPTLPSSLQSMPTAMLQLYTIMMGGVVSSMHATRHHVLARLWLAGKRVLNSELSLPAGLRHVQRRARAPR